MTISEVIREVQRMIGDSAGEIVSKEFLLQCINEEAQRVAARYPNVVRVSHTPAAESNVIEISDMIEVGSGMKIMKVYVNGCQVDMVAADDIERLIENES